MTVEQTTEEPSRPFAMGGKSFDPSRIYVALLFIPLFYGLVRYLHVAAFFFLVLIVAGFALTEYLRLHFSQDRLLPELSLAMGATGVLLMSMQWPGHVPVPAFWIFTTFVLLASRWWREGEFSRTLPDAGVLLLGIAYIGLGLGHLLLLRALDEGMWLIFFLLFVTWGTDTGGFVIGRMLGRHRLAPRISPNKTVEGLWGGIAFALLFAVAAQAWFLSSLTLVDCVVVSLIISLTAVVGDLVESAMKRGAGVKDSGMILPGHGGMLDRIDSLLFTAPSFYYYMAVMKGAALP